MLPIPRKVWCLQIAAMVPILVLATAAWIFTVSLAYIALMHLIDGEIGQGIGVVILTVIGTGLVQPVAAFVGTLIGEPFMLAIDHTAWGKSLPSDDELREVEVELEIMRRAIVALTVLLTVVGFGIVLAVGGLDQWT